MALKSVQFYHTIQFRISLIVAGIIFVAVMAASSVNAIQSFEREIENHRSAVAGAGSAYVAAIADPVAAQDHRATISLLRGIRELPNVSQADVKLPDGKYFAQLGSGAALVRDSKDITKLTRQQLWRTSFLRVELPIIKGGEQIGTLGLLSDVSGLRRAVISGFTVTAISAVLAIIFGIACAQLIIARMTRPLRQLTSVMANFADDGDMAVPHFGERRDETGILTDAFSEMISRIHERDRRIATHVDTLEDTVEQRTQDLRLARDEAEAANAAKSDFLATMGHEIRTPMNGMLVMAEMLSAADLSPRHRRYANIISRSGNGLLTIINDILDLSKIESGHLELESIAVSPEALATDIVSLFWERARQADLQLAAYISPRVPKQVSADPTRLNQIITNLVNNALKFTETGGVLIDIDCQPSTVGETVQLTIAVRDTGIGIPADKIEHIFEAFSQADQTTTRKFGGTGLGLAVCRRLVNAMQGEISVESDDGQGSTFSVSIDLPVISAAPPRLDQPGLNVRLELQDGIEKQALTRRLLDYSCRMDADRPELIITKSTARADLRETQKAPIVILSDIGDTQSDQMLKSGTAVDCLPNPYSASDISGLIDRATKNAFRGETALQAGHNEIELPDFTGLRVLAADDNAVNREVLREALNTLQVEAVFAENGAEALKLATSDTFDLIFMDGSMPVMDGFEATQKIRGHELQHQAKRVPIYALTAQVAGRDTEAWRDVGADGHIAKPFTLKTLARTFSKLNSAPNWECSLETAGPNHSGPLLDQDTITSLDTLGGSSAGPSVRTRIWGMFKDKALVKFSAIEALSPETNASEISKEAHALKSMALSAGARALAETLHAIEKAANQDTKSEFLCMKIGIAKTILHNTLNEMEKYNYENSSEAA